MGKLLQAANFFSPKGKTGQDKDEGSHL